MPRKKRKAIDAQDGIVVPRYPDSVTVPDEPTQAMIEAGWRVFDRAGIEAPEVEMMQALWRAMDGAR